MNNRLLILYLPTPNQVMAPSPYLGLAVLKGYLTRAGKDVRIDDIEMKYWDKDITDNRLLRPLVRKLPLRINNPKKIFLDLKAVNRYLDSDILHRQIKERLKEWEALLIEPAHTFSHIGMSIHSIQQLSVSLCFAKYLKDTYKVKIVFGGSFFTQRMRGILEKYPFVDYIIVQEGEVALKQLLEEVSPEDVENLLYRKEGEVRVNELMNKYVDNREPDFTDLPFDLYKKDKVLIIPYETSKGCKNNCSFCVLGKKPLSFKKPQIVADEIERMKGKYGVSCFSFIDNAINISKDYSIDLCNEFIRRGLNIRWTAHYIAEEASEDYFKLLRDAGCVQLRWGIETLSPKILAMMNKRINDDEVRDALKKSASAGIWNHLFFIMGHPQEGLSDILKIFLFLCKERKYFKSARLTAFNMSTIDQLVENHRYSSCRGTLIFRKLKQYTNLGLSYKEYNDILFPFKNFIFQIILFLYNLSDVSIGKVPFCPRRHLYDSFCCSER